MPWCPTCKTEYSNGFSDCIECNEELVENRPDIELDKKEITDNVSFLTSVQDVNQAEIIESLLDSYDIPVLKKHKGAGEVMDIYMGFSFMGIDIYVPELSFENAKEILQSNDLYSFEGVLPDSIDSSVTSEEERDLLYKINQDFERKRRFRAWVILLLFIPGLLTIIAGIIMYMLKYFK